MSKKAQGGSKENHKNKHQTVDQQNEPFLRVIHKKIRNLNKRLTEISELQQKENLKPEQIEKINRKNHLIEQRARLEETIAFYKQSYLENVQLFRAHQLKELDLLSRAFAVYLAHPQFPQHSKLNKLWTGFQNIQGANLNEAIINISNVLKEAANDYKLQKSLGGFVAENGEKAVEKKVENTQTHTDQIIIVRENVINEKGEIDQISIVQKIHDGHLEEVTIVVTDPIKEQEPPAPPPTPSQLEPQPEQETQPQTEQTISNQPPKEQEKAQEKTEEWTEKPEERPQTRKNYRENHGGEYRQRGEYRGERKDDGKRRYNNNSGGEKRSYRPKHIEKEDNTAKQQQKRENSQSSDEQARNFKKEEIKKLEEEGFIVVGKPKPKTNEQRNEYNRQNGKRYHNNKGEKAQQK